MIESIAAMAINMKTAEYQQSYSVAMAKKAMESYEQAAQTSIEMMTEADAPVPTKGHFIDVYA